jgi:hypothetical protein
MNPTLTRDDAEKLARARGCTDKVMILGLRSPTSKYGEYDDTIALLTPDSYTEWKGNTLPSKWEPGIAKLMPGDYIYAKGLHGINHFGQMKADMAANIRTWLSAHTGQDYPPVAGYILPYWAFRQHGPVTLIRDGTNKLETETDPAKFPFIDLHRGGWNGTSSAGCQTWFPDHWPEVRAKGYAAMDQYGQLTITYSLHQL